VLFEQYHSAKIIRSDALSGSASVNNDERTTCSAPQRSTDHPDYIDSNEKNVVVYGKFLPFVGSGVEIGGWSFPVNIQRGKADYGSSAEPKHFKIAKLYQHICKRLSEEEMVNLEISDKLFVDGSTVRDDVRFLPDIDSRPVSRVPSELIKPFVERSPKNIRHFQHVQVFDWKGEICLNVYLKFLVTKCHLYCEAHYFFLAPLRLDILAVDDRYARSPTAGFWEIAGRSAALTPFVALWSPFVSAFYLAEPFAKGQRHRQQRKWIEKGMEFNCGASESVRDMIGGPIYRDFFQRLDRDLCVKIVERRILDSIISFLDDHDIDTSELRERRTTILNNGVIVSGGSISAESLAVGQRASATISNTRAEATQT
jgi:hypothetical protein